MKKRPPTRVLCARVKEIRSIFFERTTKADASPKQKEGVKNTFSLIIAYVFFANQKEEAVFLRRPLQISFLLTGEKNA